MEEQQLIELNSLDARYADVAPVISIQQAIERHQQLAKYVSSVMIEGHDYGVTPGTTKPSLKKPGAEKLTTFFGLTKRLFIVEKIEDWTGEQHNGEPFFYYLYRCALYRGDMLIAEADGSCNSRETKYRWREMQRSCPQCHAVAIIRGKEEFGGGWVCFGKKGGCGAKFEIDDSAITSQQVGRVANPDIADQVNTIQKMAAKRALVAATLLAVNASEFFTQDVEDFTAEHAAAAPAATNGAPRATQPIQNEEWHTQPATKSEPATPPAKAQAMPANPLATDLRELATPKQCVKIRALARELDIDADAELRALCKLDCKVEEISRRAASVFIDHLLQLQQMNVLPIVRRAGDTPTPAAPPATPATKPPVAMSLVTETAPLPVVATPSVSAQAQPPKSFAPTATFSRDDAIAEIKNLVLQLKFATNLPMWREFERGLFGKAITETTDQELKEGLLAVRDASVNTEIVRWNSEKWIGAAEKKAYTMGLIFAHAHVDGFEKTKALVGDPRLYRSEERMDLIGKNLLSWVRSEQLQEAA